VGIAPRAWQDTTTILGQLGAIPPRARRAYHAYVAAGLRLGRCPEFQGGGLLRSLGVWRAVTQLRRGREAYLGDERILGGSAFVETIRQTLRAAEPTARDQHAAADLVAAVCAANRCHRRRIRDVASEKVL